ncbi:zinc ribbon domain-containing protein [Paractinoplanes globisporus]|uniref:Zinc ribbon domain-containing protein n=1 Tax=Paractinoplanes globisporus TaxID=113565 RepID=A0ABW6WRH6_9ACTN
MADRPHPANPARQSHPRRHPAAPRRRTRTSSTCPYCRKRIPKPAGRTMSCPHCQFAGHRDLAAAFTIATRTPGGATTPIRIPAAGLVTHRRAGRHLPGVATARRDPRRRPPATGGSLGRRRPAPFTGESLAHTRERGSTTPPDPTRSTFVDTPH